MARWPSRRAGAVVDDRELRRSGPTYSIDTLRELHAPRRPGPSCYLLMGEDQAAAFTAGTWRRPHCLATLAVAPRGPAGPERPP
jgi:nicotinate-nucleotide adenylyltransferase